MRVRVGHSVWLSILIEVLQDIDGTSIIFVFQTH